MRRSKHRGCQLSGEHYLSHSVVEKQNGNWLSAKGQIFVFKEGRNQEGASPAAAVPPLPCLPHLATYSHGNEFTFTIFSLVSQDSINARRGWSPQALNTFHLVPPLESSTTPHCSHASFPCMKLWGGGKPYC